MGDTNCWSEGFRRLVLDSRRSVHRLPDIYLVWVLVPESTVSPFDFLHEYFDWEKSNHIQQSIVVLGE